MIALSSRVLGYTTNLTKLGVATMPELGEQSWISRTHGMCMPEVLTMLDLGQWSSLQGALNGVQDC